eukprot:903852-Rhodomonas_salina.1
MVSKGGVKLPHFLPESPLRKYRRLTRLHFSESLSPVVASGSRIGWEVRRGGGWVGGCSGPGWARKPEEGPALFAAVLASLRRTGPDFGALCETFCEVLNHFSCGTRSLGRYRSNCT